MPIRLDDFDEFDEEAAKQADRDARRNSRQHGDGGFTPGPDTDSEAGGMAEKLFTAHPPSGGPFGGQDNALTRLVWFLRAKRWPFEEARRYALNWADEYCPAHRGEDWVLEKVGRVWAEWLVDAHEDATPDDVKGKKKEAPAEWQVFSAADLLAFEATSGGTQWLVPDVFIRGGLHFISAPSGVAKSWLLLELARCVASGVPWLTDAPLDRGAVVYVDEEMGPGDASVRVRKLGLTPDADFTYIGKQQFRIYNAPDRARLAQMCREKNAALVCFDTMAAIWPGLRENESAEVTLLRAYFEEIRKASGAAVVVAHHDKKNSDPEAARQNRMAGSRDFAAMSDMTYSVEKHKDYYHLEIGKNRHLPDDDALNLDFEIADQDDKTRVVIRAIDAEAAANRRVDAMGERIMQTLREHGSLGTNDLVEKVGGKKEIVIAAAQRLFAAQRVVCTEAARGARIYALP